MPNVVIHQKEFVHLRMIESFCGADMRFRKTRWFWSRVGVECGTLNVTAARPETGANHLMRIGLPCNRICPFPRRRSTSRKARDRQIEAAPKEMHWAALADKAGPKLFEDF